MFATWIVSSAIIAAISFGILVGNVAIGYSDGWVSQDGKKAIRLSSVAFLLSPTGFFIVPLAAGIGVLWLLFKIIKGVIIFGFVKEVPLDENGEPKEKITHDVYS
jgi:hypothetical protein